MISILTKGMNPMNKILMILLTALCVSLAGGSAAAADWTFMVYLDADNNLESDGISDFLEMSAQGSTDDINIVVQFDRIPGYSIRYDNWTDCQRFYITSGLTPLVANAVSDWGDGVGGREVNMADPQTLEDFVAWTVENYPADHYALILWNHGGGWRDMTDTQIPGDRTVCWDDTSGDDGLDTREIQTALQSLVDDGTSIDLIGFDACVMGTLEVAYELKDLAQAMVASEESEPGEGWSYTSLLTALAQAPNSSPLALGGFIVDAYADYCGTNSDYTLSCLDLTAVDALADAVDVFAQTLQTYADKTKLYTVRQEVCEYNDMEVVDIYDFADGIEQETEMDQVAAAALDVKAAVGQTVTAEYHGDGSECSHGVTIYFPFSRPFFDDSYNETVIDFPGNNQWDEFLMWYYEAADSALTLNLPVDGEIISSNVTPEFSWTVDGSADYLFKLEFSPTSDFTRVFYVPRRGWMPETSTESLPTNMWETVWAILQTIEKHSGQLFWRVIARPLAQGEVCISEARVFSIE